MKLVTLSLACLALIVPLAAAAQAVTSPVAPPSAADEVERGRALYMNNGCFSCHGTLGQGGPRAGAPRLAPDPYPFEAFRVLVRTPREAMPRYEAKYISDSQLLAIHSYLASIGKGPGFKDIAVLRDLVP